MEISKKTLNKTLLEVRWVIQELSSILPESEGGCISASVEDCLDRLRLAMSNLEKKTKDLTKRKEKKHV